MSFIKIYISKVNSEAGTRARKRSLPKTDAGLYDMNKVRPIALMEIMLKLLERILFTKIESGNE